MNRNKVLAELTAHQDNYISGQELADRLSISRVAIWKHIAALKEQGYDIRAVSGRGYQLTRGGPIDPQVVQDALADALIGNRIIFLPRVDSTNETLKRMHLEPGLAEGTVLVAGTQERGKGRIGRRWESPLGGLWFSVYLQPRTPLESIALLSLIFSLAISRVLEGYTPVAIKWPNDVYASGKKLSGILLETSGELDAPEYLISGIGINTNLPINDFPIEMREISTSLLEQVGITLDHNDLLIEILHSMDQYYRRFLQEGFLGILPEYKERCFHLGKPLEIRQGTRMIRGINTDVNE
ncbi:MAG: biotin--[acetyl-CoA-carboxylase] ligase, partial [Syntrophomonadaceae bacterium]|nr:biotin--[acetyl-CoA-carboxylase] ligase [Syntrophomonadaceae bacterium]